MEMLVENFKKLRLKLEPSVVPEEEKLRMMI
jgi:hypothetical protein